jgi:hypothetical protein
MNANNTKLKNKYTQVLDLVFKFKRTGVNLSNSEISDLRYLHTRIAQALKNHEKRKSVPHTITNNNMREVLFVPNRPGIWNTGIDPGLGRNPRIHYAFHR